MSNQTKREQLAAKLQMLQEKTINFTRQKRMVVCRIDFMDCYDDLHEFFTSNALSHEDQKYFVKWYETNLENYFARQFSPLLHQKTGEALLDEFLIQWNNFKILVSMMKKILTWLDRGAFQLLLNKSLTELSFSKLRTKIYGFMSTKMFNTIYNFLEKVREEKEVAIPHSAIKKIIEIYESLGGKNFDVELRDGEFTLKATGGSNQYFDKYFQTSLIEKIRSRFREKAERWIQLSAPEYLDEATDTLRFEEKQCEYYYPNSRDLVRKTIMKEICRTHSEKLVVYSETELYAMLENKKYEELGKVCFLLGFGGPSGLNVLTRAYSNYIEKTGQKIIEEAKANHKGPMVFVEKAIELKREMDKVETECFQNRCETQQSHDASFKNFINSFEKSPSFLSFYLDFQFTQDIKGKSDREIEDMLVYFTKIISYLRSRDAFISRCRNLLCKRLLNGSSLSLDVELNIISKISVEFGTTSVSALLGMLVDVTTSEDLKKQFSQMYPNNPIETLVCSLNNWPMVEQNHPARLPAEMTQATKDFEKFYMQLPKYHSRTLTWILSEGKGEVLVNFGNTRYILEVKTHQMCILLRFNECSEYTFAKLKVLTGVDEELLNEYLTILTSQVPVLKRGDETKKDGKFDDEEVVFINRDFKSEKRRLLCFSNKTKVEKKSPAEEAKFQKQLELEREHTLDSIIVRVMKSYRILKYNDLLSEIDRQTTLFRPQPKMVKTRIDSLIEREYLERDKERPHILTYLP